MNLSPRFVEFRNKNGLARGEGFFCCQRVGVTESKFTQIFFHFSFFSSCKSTILLLLLLLCRLLLLATFEFMLESFEFFFPFFDLSFVRPEN